jgi:hypothetical protein
VFLLTPDRPRCQGALSKLRTALPDADCGPIALLPVGESWLGWFRARRADNLHVFSDAFIVGKLSPGEPATGQPVSHPSPAPASVHPLVSATRIETVGGTLRIVPQNSTNVFYDRDSASDMQLLVADAKGYAPAPSGVAILGTVGHLPGNLTLFGEISRIPPFHALDVAAGQLRRVGRFERRTPDDEALIDRLVSTIPASVSSVLACSGGCDSRFVLAILRKAGVRPGLVRLSDDEDAAVARLAEALGLSLTIVREPAPDRPPLTYTIMTDAQIYFRGGHYGRIRDAVPADVAYYTGLYANSILKNAMRATWKVPRMERNMTTRLVEHGLLANMRPREAGLRAFGDKATLMRFLRDHIASAPQEGPFERRKEQAAWFAFSQKATRWNPAHLGDLSLFAEPVQPLSDLAALELAIGTSAWSNFGNDRVRRLNERLLPGVNVEYASGQRRVPRGWPLGAIDKLAYEYGSRAFAYFRGRRPVRSTASRHVPPEMATHPENAAFRGYFDRSFAEIAAGGGYSASLRRAAVTVNSALHYLEGTMSDVGSVFREEFGGRAAAGAREGRR